MAPSNRNLLTIEDAYCQNKLKYDHLKAENVPHGYLIGAISACNCLYLGHYFSDRAEICQ